MDYGLSPEEMRVFLEEAEEQLSLLEEDLLTLEKIDNDAEYQRLLQEIFRAAHTLKGAAAAIGHQRMASLTHAMETLLDKVRHRELEVSSSLVNAFLEGLDYLARWKDEIATSEDSSLDASALVEKLKSFQPGSPAEPSDASPPPNPALSAAVQNSLLAREEGFTAYSISVRIDPSCPMLSVRAFQALLALEQLGEVLESVPSREVIEGDQEIGGDLSVVLLSPHNAETIRATLLAISDLRDVHVVPVEDEAYAPAPPATATPMGSAETPAATPNAVDKQAVTSPPATPFPASSTPEAAAPPALASPAQSTASGGAATPEVRRSHTIRVDTELLDNLMNLVGELVIDRTRLTQLVGGLSAASLEESSKELSNTAGHIARISNLLQEEVMKVRMVPIETLFKKFPRMVRDLSQRFQKEIDFVIEGQDTELDRQVSEEMSDPLIHLLRNSVDHGVEAPDVRERAGKPRLGTIRLAARQEENQIIISVQDDGAGINPEKVVRSALENGVLTQEAATRLQPKEAINLIFAAGVSTAGRVSEVSGRGVGMDVVKNNIQRLNGTIEVFTHEGAGSEFRIRLPLTLAILRALLVRFGEATYAVPLSAVTEAIRLDPKTVYTVNRQPVVKVRNRILPLVNLGASFGSQTESHPFAVLVQTGGERFGLAVDALVGEQEIVIKGLGKFLGDILTRHGNPGLSGATILGNGRVALILDLAGILRQSAGQSESREHGDSARMPIPGTPPPVTGDTGSRRQAS